MKEKTVQCTFVNRRNLFIGFEKEVVKKFRFLRRFLLWPFWKDFGDFGYSFIICKQNKTELLKKEEKLENYKILQKVEGNMQRSIFTRLCSNFIQNLSFSSKCGVRFLSTSTTLRGDKDDNTETPVEGENVETIYTVRMKGKYKPGKSAEQKSVSRGRLVDDSENISENIAAYTASTEEQFQRFPGTTLIFIHNHYVAHHTM